MNNLISIMYSQNILQYIDIYSCATQSIVAFNTTFKYMFYFIKLLLI